MSRNPMHKPTTVAVFEAQLVGMPNEILGPEEKTGLLNPPLIVISRAWLDVQVAIHINVEDDTPKGLLGFVPILWIPNLTVKFFGQHKLMGLIAHTRSVILSQILHPEKAQNCVGELGWLYRP